MDKKDNRDCISRRPIFLRIPEELRSQLWALARASERTLTAEIVYRLKTSVNPHASEVTS
jgi:Arc-like DNA binding domain